MDANKDSAEQCIRLARGYLRDGKIESAVRCLEKGRRLYPSVNTSGLESLLSSQRKSAPQSPKPEPRRRSLSRKRNNAGHHTSTKESNSHSEFPKTQLDSIRKVLNCKDYYAILGVTKESSDDDIKKAYKSLALKFHPDKNKAPGATEAFKKIGTAASVLTDSEKRRKYDLYGSTDDRPQISSRAGDNVYFETQGFDEVYHMFFSSGFPFSNVYRQQRHRPSQHQREPERDGNFFVYIQLLPLLVLFGLSFFSGFFVKDPNFNLAKSDKYPVERMTNSHHINYYVKHSFNSDFDGSIHSLEKQVEEEFATNLRYRCYREKEHRENLMFRARYYGDDENYRRASRSSMPNCDRLTEMFGG